MIRLLLLTILTKKNVKICIADTTAMPFEQRQAATTTSGANKLAAATAEAGWDKRLASGKQLADRQSVPKAPPGPISA